MNNRQQFGIRHLFIATLVVALTIAIVPHLGKIFPEHRYLSVLGPAIAFGMFSRWLGWKLSWPPGAIGRHAIAFFFATIGFAGIGILANYSGSWSELIQDIREGLGLAALIYGVWFGSITEFGFCLLSIVYSTIYASPRPVKDEPNGFDKNRHTAGLPSSEHRRM